MAELARADRGDQDLDPASVVDLRTPRLVRAVEPEEGPGLRALREQHEEQADLGVDDPMAGAVQAWMARIRLLR